MKIGIEQLKKIIKEEIANTVKEVKILQDPMGDVPVDHRHGLSSKEERKAAEEEQRKQTEEKFQQKFEKMQKDLEHFVDLELHEEDYFVEITKLHTSLFQQNALKAIINILKTTIDNREDLKHYSDMLEFAAPDSPGFNLNKSETENQTNPITETRATKTRKKVQ